MNEIILRTNKGEYNPGESVYGVVYLNICNPTAGRGVRLKFEGVESISYHCSGNDDREGPVLTDSKFYIDAKDVILYTCEDTDVMGIGSFCFPFKVSLLSEIPGSFSSENAANDGKWLASVQYWLKAELVGAESISTMQFLIVNHPLPSFLLPNDPPMAVDCRIEVSHLLLFKKSMHVTAKLTKQVWQAGDVAKLKIIITNNTNVNVSKITIKLCRELILVKKGIVIPCYDPKVTVDEGNDRMYIRPEGVDPKVVWENMISGCNQELLNKGLDNIRIPLRNEMESSIESSVTGSLIQCFYYIDICVTLQNHQEGSLTVPIYCLIHSKNTEFLQWKPPSWIYESEVIMGKSIFSVSETALRSEAFSDIPRFQALESDD
ncbi:arrestin domain-containing protein A-like isoform X1 [Crassostrea angulata]|uniref:arrestin domain-containing protein A isoform X1 n=1 Tax=Magallana gigas TaxID=29159 RepID=UPI0005C37905|nr:arrestin domain-containing protein A-like isoform X1 [Crassostrea angulata]|eukprot:XP_019926949.1 PREDICTED: arrestin domain-containing protein A isoform X1 [Crassostrea gigas]